MATTPTMTAVAIPAACLHEARLRCQALVALVIGISRSASLGLRNLGPSCVPSASARATWLESPPNMLFEVPWSCTALLQSGESHLAKRLIPWADVFCR